MMPHELINLAPRDLVGIYLTWVVRHVGLVVDAILTCLIAGVLCEVTLLAIGVR